MEKPVSSIHEGGSRGKHGKAEMVKTTGTIALQGLESDEFFKFFKTLIVGGNKHEYDQEDLDDLATDIAKKLKGSPLAAKTVGRLLS